MINSNGCVIKLSIYLPVIEFIRAHVYTDSNQSFKPIDTCIIVVLHNFYTRSYKITVSKTWVSNQDHIISQFCLEMYIWDAVTRTISNCCNAVIADTLRM